MNFGNQRQSTNYVDHSNLINQNHPYVPVSTLTGRMPVRPPSVPFDSLTPEEKHLVDNLGFGPDDILLMRLFKSNPEQVLQGWHLLKKSALPDG